MRQKEWERRRKGVLNGWHYQLLSRETIIQEQLGKWTFAVMMRGHAHVAHILVQSFDYYERRLHLRHDKQPITLLICLAHTTCVPLHVEVLDVPMSYDPYQLPAIYTPEKRRTVLGKRVVLGQLIAQTVDPDEALVDFAPSTRFAYLARMKHLLKPLPGRAPAL